MEGKEKGSGENNGNGGRREGRDKEKERVCMGSPDINST